MSAVKQQYVILDTRQIVGNCAMLKQHLDQNFRLVDGWRWVKK